MNERIQPGRYPARATGVASVYENAKGSLVLAMEFHVEGQVLKWLTTLATEDNGINTRTIERLKQCFGWDGLDVFWFVEHPEAYIERDVEVTVEHRQGDKATFVNIAFVDPPGGGHIPASGNKASLLAKYGSKLRAISGGTPAKAPTPAAKPPAKVPAKVPPPAAKAKAPPSASPSNQMAVWERFAEVHQEKSEDDRSSLWFDLIEKHFPGVDQGDLSPEQWGHLFEQLDQIPF